MQNVARLMLQNSRQFSRTSAASSAEVAEGYKQLKHIQAKFQVSRDPRSKIAKKC